METYRIVNDRDELLRFIDWLPELGVDEKFMVSLFARKKYASTLIKSNDKTQLKRFLTTKERLEEKLLQLELPLGRWKLGAVEAPQDSLVAYIHPNPRCMVKANEILGKKLWDLRRGTGFNIVAEALSASQKAKSRSWVVDFDIDEKIDLKILDPILPSDCYDVVETRSGYHILVKPKEATKANKLWHPQLLKLADQGGDQFLPIPGTIQGGFIPRLLANR